MNVSTFGLGYVGTVSAGCLANDGHEVVGVDPIQAKVYLTNQGCTLIIEQEICDNTTANVKSGRLRAVCDPPQVGPKYGRRSVITTTWSDKDGLL